MSWITKANKRGKYENTYRGFRIYCTKFPQVHEWFENRPDGKYRITEFIKGEFLAIDKTGTELTESNIEALAYKIDIELFLRE